MAYTPTIITRCCDCSLGTNVAREWYMVKPKVWKEAWTGRRKPWHELPGQSVLCVGCLERRIGRTLCAADFADAVVNDPEGDISDRLRQRLMATKSQPLDGAPPVKRKRGCPKGSKNKPKVVCMGDVG
jgi:hypothetical protein